MKTRKNQIINEIMDLYARLCEYRGIPCDIEADLHINKKWSISKLNDVLNTLTKQLTQPLEEATNKQMNYILYLSEEFEDKEKIQNAKLNKFQASKLIEIYKAIHKLVRCKYTMSGDVEVFKDFDRKIDFILSHKTIQ